VREDGQWPTGFSAANWELRHTGKALLVHFKYSFSGVYLRGRMHTLLKYLSPEICITWIGVAESWRCGLKVVLRQ
jgi:hypothetical protein